MASHFDNDPHSLLSLSFRANGLRKTDFIGKDDCMVVLKEQDNVLGKTEVVMNSNDPIWQMSIDVTYRFEQRQILSFEVLDYDGNDRWDAVGDATCSLAEIVNPEPAGSKTKTLQLLHKGKPAGTLMISAVEKKKPAGKSGVGSLHVDECLKSLAICEKSELPQKMYTHIRLTLSAKNLKAKDFFSQSSDPYCLLQSNQEEIGKTEVIKKNLNPVWPSILVRYYPGMSVLMSVFDWDRTSADDLIGSAQITFDVEGDSDKFHAEATLYSKRGTPHGTIIVNGSLMLGTRGGSYSLIANAELASGPKEYYCALASPCSLFSMMQAGVQIEMTCAIDYTSSNGSMHDINPKNLNPYEECIKNVAPILLEYNHSKKVRMLGYGGHFKNEFLPFFELCSDQVVGLDGMMATYRSITPTISKGDMGSATGGDMGWRADSHSYYSDDFYQCINDVCDRCLRQWESHQGFRHMPPAYHVLFFIIDGDTFRKEGTERAIVRASSLPISIILIGVGPSSFDHLSSFDSDVKPIYVVSDKVSAVRDCVQFVRFEDYKVDTTGIDMPKLSSDLLKEIPNQVQSFCGLYGLQP